MSSAAVALQPSPHRRPPGRSASKSAPLPSWTDGSSPDFLHWLPVPVSFFEQAFRRLTGLEAQVLGLIARYTYGDDRSGRPEWLELSLQKFAGLTGAHKNGVAIAIDRLERAGAIDSERVGRGKRYRVAVHRWSSLKELPPEEGSAAVEEEEPEEQSEDAGASAGPTEPVIRMGKHSVPLSSVPFCKDCAEKVIAAVRTVSESPKPTPFKEPSEGEKANNGRIIGTVQCANQPMPTVKESLPVAVGADPEDSETAMLQAFLARQFAKKLGEPPPHRLVVSAVADLRQAGVPLSDLLTRIDARRGVFKSYGILPNLVVDVINAHAAVAKSVPKPRQPEPVLSIADRIRSHATALIPVYEQEPGCQRAVDSLVWVQRHAVELADDQVKLLEVLEAAEIVAAAAVMKGLPKFEANAVNADAQAFVGPRRARLTRDQFDYELERYKAPIVLKSRGLPRLVLNL